MNRLSKKLNNLLIGLLVLGLVLIVSLVFIFYYTRPFQFYSPYLADDVAVVFKDATAQSDDYENNFGSFEFVLSDVQDLQSSDHNVAVLNYYDNQDKNFKAVVDNADRIYINLFDTFAPASKFLNNFDIKQGFDVKSTLSKNTNLQIAYSQESQTLNFFVKGQSLKINDQSHQLRDYLVFKIDDIKSNSILQLDDLIIDLSTYDNDINITLADLTAVEIIEYELINGNLLADQNSSFEQGLWDDQVSDCSAYLEGEPVLDIELSSDATQGRNSLLLSSENHFACSFKDFNVSFNNDDLYVLSFDYKNIEGGKLQYYYNVINQFDLSQEYLDFFEADNNNWNNFSTIIYPEIEDPIGLSVYFYAPSDGSQKIVNAFDNVKLGNYKLRQKKVLPLSIKQGNITLFNGIVLSSSENYFEFESSGVNLLDKYNPSFEQGPWLDEVVDCSDYLPGEPKVGLSLVDDATHGEKALRLSSDNHFACLFNSFPVNLDNGKIYQLSFDYKNIEGDKVQYFYTMSNDYSQVQDGFDSLSDNSQAWQTQQVIIDPVITNPTNFEFYLYAPSDGSSRVVNIFDNVSLHEIAPNEIYSYFLYANQTKDSPKVELPEISFATVNRWHDQVKLTGVSESLLLVYPREYEDDWHVFTSSGVAVPDNLHYLSDGFGNAWWLDLESLCIDDGCEVNEDGTYNLNLEIINNSHQLTLASKILLVGLALILMIGLVYARKK